MNRVMNVLVVAGFVSVLGLLLGTQVASADLIPLAHPSFDLPDQVFGHGAPTGWNGPSFEYFGTGLGGATFSSYDCYTNTNNVLWQNTGYVLQRGDTLQMDWSA